MADAKPVPDHVPPELVRDFSLWTSPGMERAPGGDPQAALSFLHQGPKAFYAKSNTWDGTGSWVFVRAEDQRRILGDPATFTSRRDFHNGQVKVLPLELDPPEHTHFRTLLNPMLSPKRVEAMEAGARAKAVRLIESFKDKGSCEIMKEFAWPFAAGVFLQFLGISEDRRDEFLQWADHLLHGSLDQRDVAMRTVRAFIEDRIAERRRNPADDFIGFLLNAKVNGRPLEQEEIVGVGFLLFIAGLDNVAVGIGFGLNHLAKNPQDQTRVRRDRELIKPAIEEFLRAFSTVTAWRRAAKDVEFEGCPIKKGDVVACPTMTANRDPNEFPNPDRVDVARENNRHAAFVYGPHRCIGSHLARRELTIALEEVLDRVPTFRIKAGTSPITYGGYVFGIENLVLDWT